MATQPDQIRNEIEMTRSELAADVDRLADRTNPKRIAQRRLDSVRSAMRRTSERVMGAPKQAAHTTSSGMGATRDRMRDTAHVAGERAGSAAQNMSESARQSAHSMSESARETAHSVSESARNTAHSVADSARQAPDTVIRQTQGNPLAVGLIAFGAGLLAASLLPETEAERRMADQLSERTERFREPLKQTASQLGEELGDKAREAAGQVKQTATEAMSTTKEQATESGREAAQRTKQSMASG